MYNVYRFPSSFCSWLTRAMSYSLLHFAPGLLGVCLDIKDNYGVSVSSFYESIHMVVDAINTADVLALKFPTSFADLKKNADEFGSKGPLYGCVGCLDGLAIRIRCPVKCPNCNSYYNRKGFFSFNMQGLLC